MTGLRGFGMVITIPGMASRHWYADASGRKRWADTDEPFTEHDPDAKRSARDDAFIAAMQQGIPPMRPDDLDVIDMDNNAIEPIRDSAIAAEDAGQMPRTNYTDGSK
mgnify:CR=1 FL=1